MRVDPVIVSLSREVVEHREVLDSTRPGVVDVLRIAPSLRPVVAHVSVSGIQVAHVGDDETAFLVVEVDSFDGAMWIWERHIVVRQKARGRGRTLALSPCRDVTREARAHCADLCAILDHDGERRRLDRRALFVPNRQSLPCVRRGHGRRWRQRHVDGLDTGTGGAPVSAMIEKFFFCLTGPYLTRRATIGRLEPPLGRGRFVCDPPTRSPHKYNGLYGPGFIRLMTPGDTLPPPSRHIEPPFSVGEVREVVEHLPWGGFADCVSRPAPGWGGVAP